MDDLFPKALSPLQKGYLTRIAETLQNMGVQFAIVEPDGTAHGNATLEVKKERTRIGSVLPYGVMKQYIIPFLEDMKPGDSRVIPCPDFFPADWTPRQRVNHLQKSITSHCSANWERGAYTTASSEEQLTVEILRMEPAQ